MRLRVGQKIVAAFAVPFAAVLLTSLVAVNGVRELSALNSAAQFGNVLGAVGDLHSDAELKLALFVATGQPANLRAYTAAVTRLQPELSSLVNLARADSARRQGVERIRTLVAGEVESARTLAALSRERAAARAAETLRAGHLLEHSTAVRAAISSLRRDERQRLAKRFLAGASSTPAAAAVVSAVIVFAVAAVVLACVWMRRTINNAFAGLLSAMKRFRDGVFDSNPGGQPDAAEGFAPGFDDMAVALTALQSELKQSSQILRLVLDSMADGVVVADKAGKLLLLNRSAVDIFGATPSNVNVKSWDKTYDLRYADGQPLRAERDLPLLIATQGRTVRNVPFVIRNPEGPHERCVIGSASPIVDESGLRGGVMIVTDMTERDRVQQALAESEEKFRAFVETTNEWIWSVDPAGTLTYSNPALFFILGYLPEQLLGANITDFVHADDRAEFSRQLATIGADRKGAMGLVFRWQHVHGTERWLESNIVPIVDADECVAGYRGTARDITTRQMVEAEVRRLNEQLRKRIDQLNAVNKELEAFSYSVSHDLRAPLRSIDGFSQALLEDYEDRLDGDGKDYLRRVRAASQKMAGLIDDLLNLSRVARNEISRRPVDITELTHSVAAALNEAHPGRNVEFVAAGGMRADADSRLLRIALENLLGNAWKFTRNRPDARIEIGSYWRAGELIYFVRDNGVAT
jgi:PAS domain S-box-containing protein